ncbi:hypothetical protein [Rhodococcus sp. WS3]|uniref:hypothetical protein n=1 Tax=Rhodococcus sp. WS3 TaxID=2486271 RepID=UPI001650EDCA|nr:hypothetical protein [Rhodococcus sp. WS3]
MKQNVCRSDLVFVESVRGQIQRLRIGELDDQVGNYSANVHGIDGEQLERRHIHPVESGYGPGIV